MKEIIFLMIGHTKAARMINQNVQYIFQNLAITLWVCFLIRTSNDKLLAWDTRPVPHLILRLHGNFQTWGSISSGPLIIPVWGKICSRCLILCWMLLVSATAYLRRKATGEGSWTVTQGHEDEGPPGFVV